MHLAGTAREALRRAWRLLPVAIGAFAPALAASPAEDTLAVAAELLAAGRTEEAAALIAATPLPADPDGAAAYHVARGMVALQAGDPEQAIAALGAALELRPDLVGARVAIGRAYAMAGDADRSEMQLRRALAGAGDDQRRRVVEADLAALRANRRLIGSFTFGFVPDSNVGARSSASTIIVRGVPFELNEAARRSAGIGAQLSGQVAAFTPVAEGVRLSAGLSAWHVNYEGARFDDLITRLRIGPEVELGRGSLAVGPVAYRRWYAGRGYSQSLGAFAETQQAVGAAMLLGGVVEAVRVTHDDLPLRDADSWRFDLISTFILSPTLRLRLSGGLGRDAAEDAAFSNWNTRVAAAVLTDLPNGFGAVLSHEVMRRAYDAPDFFETLSRRELRNTSRIELSNRRFVFGGLMPALAVSYERQDATSPLFAYTRLRTEITFTREF